MTKINLIATAFICGILFHAQAQLTNQVAITPSLNLKLLKESAVTGTNRFNSSDEVLFMVSSMDEKGHTFSLLSGGHTFIFDLRDIKGNVITKTELGIQTSQPIDVEKIISDIKIENPLLTNRQLADLLPDKLNLKHHTINPDRPLFNNVLVPENYFVITNKGIYTLDLQIRAWVQKTNDQYGVVVSPPMRVEIDKH